MLDSVIIVHSAGRHKHKRKRSISQCTRRGSRQHDAEEKRWRKGIQMSRIIRPVRARCNTNADDDDDHGEAMEREVERLLRTWTVRGFLLKISLVRQLLAFSRQNMYEDLLEKCSMGIKKIFISANQIQGCYKYNGSIVN